jgi:hypothetical protein
MHPFGFAIKYRGKVFPKTKLSILYSQISGSNYRRMGNSNVPRTYRNILFEAGIQNKTVSSSEEESSSEESS